ncbi:MAG: tetratricopeptide repeat protein [Pseudomonadota bacterium]
MHRLAAVATSAICLAAGPALADFRTDCAEAATGEAKVAACTQAIQSGEWSGEGLSWAYNNRGLGYRMQDKLQDALKDYDEALRLNPKNILALGNRSYALDQLGRHAEAIRDWEASLRLGGAETVKQAQRYLRDKGYYTGAIDGLYGGGSKSALRDCVPDPRC